MSVQTAQELLIKMKADKFSLLTISEKANIKYAQLDQAIKGKVELRESPLRRLFEYARSVGFDV